MRTLCAGLMLHSEGCRSFAWRTSMMAMGHPMLHLPRRQMPPLLQRHMQRPIQCHMPPLRGPPRMASGPTLPGLQGQGVS